jgi:hypothetical protein
LAKASWGPIVDYEAAGTASKEVDCIKSSQNGCHQEEGERRRKDKET